MGKYENPGESGVNGTRFFFANRYRQNRFFQVRGHDLKPPFTLYNEEGNRNARICVIKY